MIGSSGSGKSSVISAGLIPQLRTEGIWLIDTFRPKNQPFEQLAAALVRLLEPGLDKIQQLEREVDLVDMIQGKLTLSKAASKILEANPGKRRLLLVIDQFEEVYTSCSNEKQCRQFIDLLLDAVGIGNLTLVLTLRADFYGHILSYPRFGDALQQFTLQPLSSMNRGELQSITEKPLEKSSVSLEAGLTQRILDDIGEEPGNLPLLEFALFELWNKQRNGKLTHNAYNEIGGVKKAIANHAEKIYSQLDEVQKKQAEYIFTQLIYPRRRADGIRRVATRSEIGDENWSLVNYLANYREYPSGYSSRLLVTGWDERKNEDTVEIVHEALIREWKYLQKWIADAFEFRSWQESLRFSIQTWEDSKQHPSALLRGKLLIKSEKWLKLQFANIRSSEKEFIKKSRQRERLNQLRVAVLVFILSGLSVLAQGLFTDRQFEEEFSKVLIEHSASPKQVSVLRKANQRAKQQINDRNIDAGIELYKKVLKAAKTFEETAKSQANEFRKPDLESITAAQKDAETSLANVIEDNYIPDLKEQLGKKPSEIGEVIKGPALIDYTNRFTGALRTTYRILMRKPGLSADEEPDGVLGVDEVIYFPCDTLEQIDKLWRDATDGYCGFYGEDIFSAPTCKELSGSTLSFMLFESEYAEAIKPRLKSCPYFKGLKL